MNSPTSMRLADGSCIELSQIDAQKIPLQVVAEALAGTTRGNGHWTGYNNANHALNCGWAYLAATDPHHELTIPNIVKVTSSDASGLLFQITCALACLHHDDGEAIVPDISRPLARLPFLRDHVEAIKVYERQARESILSQHGIPTSPAAWEISEIVDRWTLGRELDYMEGNNPLPHPLRKLNHGAACRYLGLHDELMLLLRHVLEVA